MSDQQPPAVPGDVPPPHAVQPYGSYAPPPPAYSAYPAAGAPGYGVDPLTGAPWSDKTRTTAGLLSLLLPMVGICGVGRLYAGQVGLGLAQLLGFFVGLLLTPVLIGFVIFPAVWLWSVVDGILFLVSGGKDAYGRALR